jgi:hypothetical protein
MDTQSHQNTTLSGIHLTTLVAAALILVVGTAVATQQLIRRIHRLAQTKDGRKRELQVARSDQAAVLVMQNEGGPTALPMPS